MSCNSCSNVTLPGVPGPAGSNGAPGVDGVGITSIVFNSTTNPGGTAGVAGYIDTYRIEYTNGTTQDYDVANGSNGGPGTDGVAILKIIGDESSDYTSSSPGRPTIPVGDSFPWTVPSGTLSSDYDALQFEGLIYFTKGDALKEAQIKINTTNINVSQGTNPMAAIGAVFSFQFKATFIRTSSTTLRVESSTVQVSDTGGVFNFSTNEMLYTDLDFSSNAFKNGQVVTVSDMGSNSFDVDLEFSTANVAQPLKLVNCKLLKLKKV